MNSPIMRLRCYLVRDGGVWVAVCPQLETIARGRTEDDAARYLLRLIQDSTCDDTLREQRVIGSDRFLLIGDEPTLAPAVRAAADRAAGGYAPVRPEPVSVPAAKGKRAS